MLRKVLAGIAVLTLVATATAQASKSPRQRCGPRNPIPLRILEQKLPRCNSRRRRLSRWSSGCAISPSSTFPSAGRNSRTPASNATSR